LEAAPLARYVEELWPLSLMLTCKPTQAKKVVSYAESDDEDDEDAFDPAGINTQKRKLQRKSKVVESEDDDDDAFIGGLDGAADDDDDGKNC
jgi:DNA mismatch repair protein MSH6